MNSKYLRRSVHICVVTVLSGLFMTAGAAPAERPKEKDKVFEFKGEDMRGYGAAVNADLSRLGRLFGTTVDMDVPRIPQGETEEKGWLGIAMKLSPQAPKEPGASILQAIEVATIMPGSAAEEAGLREGDLIVGLDGGPVESKEDKTLLAFRLAISGNTPAKK